MLVQVSSVVLLLGIHCAFGEVTSDNEALLQAAIDGDVGVIGRILTNYKPGTLAGDSFWRTAYSTPLHMAAATNHLDAFQMLWPEFKELGKTLDNTTNTAIHWAVQMDAVDILKFIVESDRSYVNLPEGDAHELPVHQAWSLEAARILVEHGADLTAWSDKGFSPINMEAMYGLLEILKYFLTAQHITDLNEVRTKNSKFNLLHCVAQGESSDEAVAVAKYLVENGVNVYERGIKIGNGTMPIHVAAACANVKVVKYLLSIHPDLVSVKDDFGKTPLDFALNTPSEFRPPTYAETVAVLQSAQSQQPKKRNFFFK